MAYLSLKDFEHSWPDKRSLLEKFRFYKSAAHYWYSHIETVADIDYNAPFQNFLKKVVSPTGLKAQSWMSTHSRLKYQQPSRISEVAIQLDIEWLAELLLNKGSCGIEDAFEEDCLSQAAEHEGVVLEVLLKHERSVDFIIIDAVAWQVAAFHRHATMKLLLDRRGADIEITEAVVQAAAGNWESSKEVMTLLLDRRRANIPITEAVVESIAREFDQEVMTLLLDQGGADIQITEAMVQAAAGKWHSGKVVIPFSSTDEEPIRDYDPVLPLVKECYNLLQSFTRLSSSVSRYQGAFHSAKQIVLVVNLLGSFCRRPFLPLHCNSNHL